MPSDSAAHHGVFPEATESASSDVREYWKKELRSRIKARKVVLKAKEERARLLQTAAYVAIFAMIAVFAVGALALGIGAIKLMWGVRGKESAASQRDTLFSRASADIKELTSASSLNQVSAPP